MAVAAKKAAVVTKPRLRELYETKFKVELIKELSLKNPHQAPRLDKVVVNIGLGKGKDDKRLFETAANTLRKVTAQQPIQTKAKVSIASFKLREGNIIGMKVTLRGDRMYEFVDRLINLVLPRLRDFRGVSHKAFDKGGNYSIGLTDQSVFPELSFEETTPAHGLQVNFVINSSNPGAARALLEKLGLPFEKEES